MDTYDVADVHNARLFARGWHHYFGDVDEPTPEAIEDVRREIEYQRDNFRRQVPTPREAA